MRYDLVTLYIWTVTPRAHTQHTQRTVKYRIPWNVPSLRIQNKYGILGNVADNSQIGNLAEISQLISLIWSEKFNAIPRGAIIMKGSNI